MALLKLIQDYHINQSQWVAKKLYQYCDFIIIFSPNEKWYRMGKNEGGAWSQHTPFLNDEPTQSKWHNQRSNAIPKKPIIQFSLNIIKTKAFFQYSPWKMVSFQKVHLCT